MEKRRYEEMARAAAFAALERTYKEKTAALAEILNEPALKGIEQMYRKARKSGELRLVASFLSRLDTLAEPYVKFLSGKAEEADSAERVRKCVLQYKLGEAFTVYDIAGLVGLSPKSVGAILGYYRDEWGLQYSRPEQRYTKLAAKLTVRAAKEVIGNNYSKGVSFASREIAPLLGVDSYCAGTFLGLHKEELGLAYTKNQKKFTVN